MHYRIAIVRKKPLCNEQLQRRLGNKRNAIAKKFAFYRYAPQENVMAQFCVNCNLVT